MQGIKPEKKVKLGKSKVSNNDSSKAVKIEMETENCEKNNMWSIEKMTTFSAFYPKSP